MDQAGRILIVDDDELERRELSAEVTSLGHHVKAAVSGEEALDLLASIEFDVVLLDLDMPGIGGLATLERIKANSATKALPVIAISAAKGTDAAIHSIEMGAVDHLQKPVDRILLRARLNSSLLLGSLREKERRYRQLLENASEAVVVVQDGMPRFVNAAAIALLGVSEKEIKAEHFPTFIHPEDRAQVVERHQMRPRGETAPARPVVRLLNKKGVARWIELSSTTIEWEGHPATSYFMTDITERKRTEEALRESETRFHDFIELFPGAVFEMDLRGMLTFTNQRTLEMFGYTAQEVASGLEVQNMIMPDDRERGQRSIQRTMRGDDKGPSEHTARRKDGSGFSVLISSATMLHHGKPVGIRGVIIDITEGKRTEEALRQGEETLRLVVSSAPFPLFITDRDGTYIIDANERAVKAFGLELAQGQQLANIFTEDTGSRTVMMNIANQGFVDDMEVSLKTSKGESRWSILSARAMSYQGEERLLMATYDITERRRMERAVQQANAKLGILNSITRHDIINEVLVLSGFLELCRLREKDTKLLAYFDTMSQAADKVQKQIAFTREYQNIGAKSPEWASIGRQTAEAFVALQPNGVELKDDTEGVEILADPLAEKVPFNLIDNSMRHGEHVTHIRVSQMQVGDAMRIVYEDDGVGVSEEYKKRLFERGFGKNTGFGLFLIQEILAITGILIEEEGEAGKGVRFVMTVPPGAWRRAAPRTL